MKAKLLSALSGVLLGTCMLNAQSAQGGGAIPLGWARDFGGGPCAEMYPAATDHDNDNNVYVGGYHTDAVYAGDNNTNVLSYTGDFSTIKNGFVVKYDPNGNYIWGFALADMAGCEVTDIAVSSDSGYIYVYGNYYSSTLDFDPGVGSTGFSVPASAGSVFVAKYDLNGTFIWVKGIGSGVGQGNGSYATGIAVSDDETKLVIGGGFIAPLDLDPSAANNTINSQGMFDGFTAVYTSDGSYITGYPTGTANNDWTTDVAYGANGNVYSSAAGRFSSGGELDIAVVVSTNNLTWRYIFFGGRSSGGDEVANAIEVDANGVIWLAGYFTSNLFYMEDTNAVLSTPVSAVWAGQENAFIGRIGVNTVLAYSNTIGNSTGQTRFLTMSFDTSWNAYVGGYYDKAIYMAGYSNSGGQLDGYTAYDTIVNSVTDQICYALTVNNWGEIMAVGKVSGFPDMNSNPGAYILYDGPAERMYMAKYYEAASLGITEENSSSVVLFPNPANDNLFIRSSSLVEGVVIYTMDGQVVQSQTGVQNVVDVSSLAQGMYIVQIQTQTGVSSQRFVKE